MCIWRSKQAFREDFDYYKLGSFITSNDDGYFEDDRSRSVDSELSFTHECRNCVGLFSTAIGLKTLSG